MQVRSGEVDEFGHPDVLGTPLSHGLQGWEKVYSHMRKVILDPLGAPRAGFPFQDSLLSEVKEPLGESLSVDAGNGSGQRTESVVPLTHVEDNRRTPLRTQKVHEPRDRALGIFHLAAGTGRRGSHEILEMVRLDFRLVSKIQLVLFLDHSTCLSLWCHGRKSLAPPSLDRHRRDSGGPETGGLAWDSVNWTIVRKTVNW